jgi:hypothetical protein
MRIRHDRGGSGFIIDQRQLAKSISGKHSRYSHGFRIALLRDIHIDGSLENDIPR